MDPATRKPSAIPPHASSVPSPGGRVAARGLTVRFPDGTCALEGLDLELRAGEFVSLVGPSGCGKSTLLRVAAGLQPASSGRLELPDEGLAFVFQFPTLLPWRTIAENVALPRQLGAGADPPVADPPVADLLRLVGLAGFADHYPRQLSAHACRRFFSRCTNPASLRH